MKLANQIRLLAISLWLISSLIDLTVIVPEMVNPSIGDIVMPILSMLSALLFGYAIYLDEYY